MKKALIVCATFYPNISNSLILDAKSTLKKAKVKYKLINVPGIFEIPVTISKYLKNYDAFLALGCVIKGKTPHFKLITNATFNGLMELSIISKKPIGNGIITAKNIKQAIERKGKSKSNNTNSKKGKGFEAAKAIISVLKNVPK